jgi:hypothetical protein
MLLFQVWTFCWMECRALSRDDFAPSVGTISVSATWVLVASTSISRNPQTIGCDLEAPLVAAHESGTGT